MRCLSYLWTVAVGVGSILTSAAVAVPTGDISAEGIVANVYVTTEAGNTSLFIGQTTTITVVGSVEHPSPLGLDGIFTYDLGLFVSDPSVLSVVDASVLRPDIDERFGGSEGTQVPHGLDDVAGGYFELDRGVDASQVLFTVGVRADAVGSSTVTAGPDTDLFGVDILLAQTPDPQIIYELGPTINVVRRQPPQPGEIPEPHTAILALVGLTCGLLRGLGRAGPCRPGRGAAS